MPARGSISPSTLGIEIADDAVVVEYLDNRTVTYRGPITETDGSVRAAPGKHVHILVTDPTETEGVVLYVNDRDSHDDVLESSGVGRILLESGETDEPFPGVRLEMDGHAAVVEADVEVTRGRVFVFVEDQLGEEAYELLDE